MADKEEEKPKEEHRDILYLTLTELLVLQDCLVGSLRIADNAQIFRYTKECREQMLNSLSERMENVVLKIDPREPHPE